MSGPLGPSLKGIDEGAAIIFAQTILPGLLHELDEADRAVKTAEREAQEAEMAPYDASDDQRDTIAYAAVDTNTGYRNGVRHALARAAGILGFTGTNWLAELREYTER